MIQQLQLGIVMEVVQHHVVAEQNIEQDIYIVHIMDNIVEPQPEVHHVILMAAVIVHMQVDGLVMELVQRHVTQEQNHNTDITTLVTIMVYVGQNGILNIVIHKDAVIVHGEPAGEAGEHVQHHVVEVHNTNTKTDILATIMDIVGQNQIQHHAILTLVVQLVGGTELTAGTTVEQMVVPTIVEDYTHVKMPRVLTV